jgi:hypothetical protein
MPLAYQSEAPLRIQDFQPVFVLRFRVYPESVHRSNDHERYVDARRGGDPGAPTATNIE